MFFFVRHHRAGFQAAVRSPSAAPLTLKLSPGLNIHILVDPNDAGKSAIIDAARYVLWTRGDDYIRPDERDFHVDATGTRGGEFVVRFTFDNLTD